MSYQYDFQHLPQLLNWPICFLFLLVCLWWSPLFQAAAPEVSPGPSYQELLQALSERLDRINNPETGSETKPEKTDTEKTSIDVADSVETAQQGSSLPKTSERFIVEIMQLAEGIISATEG